MSSDNLPDTPTQAPVVAETAAIKKIDLGSSLVVPKSDKNVKRNRSRSPTTKSPIQATGAPVPQADKNLFGNSALLLKTSFTKGSAYTILERQNYGLEGLLPAQVETLDMQVERCWIHLNYFTQPMSKYHYLSALRERNETVFYKLCSNHIKEVMPYIYTPTVGEACLKFGLNYRQQEGMYISLHDNIDRVLNNWNPGFGTEMDPSIIVITDGSRILGLGDLGINGMGIPIGKLSLYCAVGGFHPMSLLPVVLDVGTNNQELLEDKFYMGTRCVRPEREVYLQFIDRVITKMAAKWSKAVIQFEDIETPYCFDLLEKYRTTNRLFNDDIQGTGVVTAAATMSSMKIMNKECGVKIMDHKFVFYGFGSASAGVADQIMKCIMLLTGTKDKEAVRNMFYMIDTQGLVTNKRAYLAPHKEYFARTDGTFQDGLSLMDCVIQIKPTFLIGLAGGNGGSFNEDICKAMCRNISRPAIFALSNPTSKAEVIFSDAMAWTNNQVIYCAGSPMEPVNGKIASQCNNLYAFPGIGFGAWFCQATVITDAMLTVAANAISDVTSKVQLQAGLLFPPMEDVAKVSNYIASAIMKQALIEDVATAEVEENDILRLKQIEEARYSPEYKKWCIPASKN